MSRATDWIENHAKILAVGSGFAAWAFTTFATMGYVNERQQAMANYVDHKSEMGAQRSARIEAQLDRIEQKLDRMRSQR